jgi:hypothetical protein
LVEVGEVVDRLFVYREEVEVVEWMLVHQGEVAVEAADKVHVLLELEVEVEAEGVDLVLVLLEVEEVEVEVADLVLVPHEEVEEVEVEVLVHMLLGEVMVAADLAYVLLGEEAAELVLMEHLS